MEEIGGGWKKLFACAVFALLLGGCAKGKGEVAVVNQTGKTIVEGRLVLGSQTFDLGGMKAGETRSFSFSCAEASHAGYQLSLTLSNQRQTLAEIGSIQGDLDYHNTLTVGKANLTLDSSRNSAGNKNLFSKGSQSIQLKWFD